MMMLQPSFAFNKAPDVTERAKIYKVFSGGYETQKLK